MMAPPTRRHTRSFLVRLLVLYVRLRWPPPPKPQSVSVNKTVGTIHNLRVFDKQSTLSQGRLVMKDLRRNNWNYFKKAAHKNRASFVELVAKNRHLLAFGPYCGGVVYEAWLKDEFPDPHFTLMAQANPDFARHQPLDEIRWLECAMVGTMQDRHGAEIPMYFDDQCRNVARALLACYAEFGEDHILLKGDPLTPDQEKWMWINLLS